MSTIQGLNVRLTASTGAFTASMSFASRSLGVVRSAFDRATDSAAAYKSLSNSVGDLKLAGRDTLTAFQNTLNTARAELQKFSQNRDVQVAVEIAREKLSESWFTARRGLQAIADKTGIRVLAGVVADKSATALDWINKQRRQLTKQITVRLALAGGEFTPMLNRVQSQLSGLQKYRAVRILLAATNAVSPVATAALRVLGPLTRLAGHGIIIALKANCR